ncbi:potassium voltage-gated channel subfamily C member 3 [Lingula anatina]|uniref:Potassium voltage-gated channel subfamily C member 3 n=1 Tax=Lingula anatina TaxID=7574 RepID=A0A1S3HCS5_LINAN|nr:potassium voltage-gated channel subfamily C member 3 [Lingula anatina]|eukprot:XP_013383828.1 potassium voltage-gated channel subfamily C member 3 [Lingula anatina]
MSEQDKYSDVESAWLTCKNNHIGDTVTINIAGTQFRTLITTLNKLPLTRLGKLSADFTYSAQSVPNEIYFDRDSMYFQPILNFYRTNILHFPHDLCVPLIRLELKFWGISECDLAPCCHGILENFDILEKEKRELEKEFNFFKTTKTTHYEGGCESWKQRVWSFLSDPTSSRGAKAWTTFYLLLLFTSIWTVALDSIEGYRVERPVNTSLLKDKLQFSDHQMLYLQKGSHPFLIYADIVVTSLFTLELLVKICVTPDMRGFLKNAFTIIDLLWAVLHWCWFTMYMTIIDTVVNLGSVVPVFLLTFLGMMSLSLRVLRLSRIVCYSSGLQVMILTLKASGKEIGLLILLLLMGSMVFGPLIFYAEMSVSSPNIENIPVGFWWAVVTMTTVGYGDMYPTAVSGYVVGGVCVVLGMVFTGLPISVISANFTKYQAFGRSIKSQERKGKTGETGMEVR